MTDWKGVFPAVTTRFTADHALDGDAMLKHCAWQVDCGVDGMITTGSLGEASTLDLDEKVEVARIALQAANGRIPVLATVAEVTTAKAREFVRKADAAGVDGFMVLPGMQYVADLREAVAHYQAVAAATDKPLMIYNNPVAYRVDLGMDGLVELSKNPQFVAIKESSDDIRRTTQILNRFGDRFRIFAGVDNLALESLFMGAHGWVAGLVDAFPEETVAIYRLYKAGRYEEALAIYRWFTPLLELDVSNKLVQNIKLAGAKVGRSTEHVRPPRLPLVGAERAAAEKIIDEALATRPKLPDISDLG